jgi:glutaredoxin
MNVMFFATKCCSYSKKLSRELDDLGVKYYLVYCDDEPELVKKYSIQKSPILIVNGEIAFRGQSTQRGIKKILNRYVI